MYLIYISKPALCDRCGDPILCENCDESLEELVPVEVDKKLMADLEMLAALQALERVVEGT